MHEYAIVEQMIKHILSEVESREACKVKEVRVRRCSTFAEGPLTQAFEILSANTPLEGATLVIEELSVTGVCEACGHSQKLSVDDLIGHLFVCPNCGAPREIDEAHGLELLGITVEDLTSP